MMRLERPTVPLETPERDMTRIPRHPGPGARVVKCKGRRGNCGQTLGIVEGPWLFVRHEGREMVSGMPCTLRCERCGSWQTVEE